MPLIIGEMVGPYRIVEQLGHGGMATVYRAYHANLDRYVAIKVLHAALKTDPSFEERFRREAQIVARLEHPNIVPVYDYNQHNGEPYLVMKFIEGETLKSRMSRERLSLAEALRIITAIADALSFAHERDILHRDVKPSNILLDSRGASHLADFGLARIATMGESTLSKDMLLGTPQYISPEQAQGVVNLAAATDVYSLGVVVYEIVVGRVPFTADTPYAIIHSHIFSPLPMPTTLNPNIPQPVERVLLKVLAKEPGDRYASAREFARAFVEAIKESGVRDLAAGKYRAGAAPLPVPPPAPSPAPEAPSSASARTPFSIPASSPPATSVASPVSSASKASPLPPAASTAANFPTSAQRDRRGSRLPWIIAGVAVLLLVTVLVVAFTPDLRARFAGVFQATTPYATWDGTAAALTPDPTWASSSTTPAADPTYETATAAAGVPTRAGGSGGLITRVAANVLASRTAQAMANSTGSAAGVITPAASATPTPIPGAPTLPPTWTPIPSSTPRDSSSESLTPRPTQLSRSASGTATAAAMANLVSLLLADKLDEGQIRDYIAQNPDDPRGYLALALTLGRGTALQVTDAAEALRQAMTLARGDVVMMSEMLRLVEAMNTRRPSAFNGTAESVISAFIYVDAGPLQAGARSQASQKLYNFAQGANKSNTHASILGQLADSGNDGYLYAVYALALAYSGQKDPALEAMSKAGSFQPMAPETRLIEGILYRIRGDEESARRTWDSLAKAGPAFRWVKDEVNRLLKGK